jgi:alpha-galactosidase
MAVVKVAMVGAGSFGFAPKLIADFIHTPELGGSTLVLHDIDAERLEVMAKLGKRMIAEAGADLRVEHTLRREEALEGAHFVTCTILVGGLKIAQADVDIPLKRGVSQSVADSVGPGGISRALRTIPVLLEICRDMERLCPKATLIDYTNPMTTLCRACRRETSIQVIGLCHGIFGSMDFMAELIGEKYEDMQVRGAGVNHLVWAFDLRCRGEDAYPRLFKAAENLFETKQPLSLRLMQIYGMYPCAGDRHVAEFFPNFIIPETDQGKTPWNLPLRGYDLSGPATTLEALRKQADGVEPLKPRAKSSETAANIMASIADHQRGVFIVNIPNEGAIEGLPHDALVELDATLDAEGIRPIHVGRLPGAITGVLERVIASQELTVEAAVTGSREAALQAMLSDAIMARVPLETTEAILDELLVMQRDYLPQFA